LWFWHWQSDTLTTWLDLIHDICKPYHSLLTSIFTDKKLNIRWKYPSYNPTYSISRLLSLTQLAVQEPVLWIRKYFFARSVILDYGFGSGRPINYGSGFVLDIFVSIEKICIRQYYKKLFLIYRFGPRRPFNYGSTAPDPDPQHCIENSATNASRTLEPFNHFLWKCPFHFPKGKLLKRKRKSYTKKEKKQLINEFLIFFLSSLKHNLNNWN